jgi:N-acetyl-gamma-glutamylphosphate reductase
MQAVTRVLGNHVKVIDHSYDFRGYPTRTYNSIFAAAEEAGISRLYGGIHTLPSINTGLALAVELGNSVGKIKLTDD